MKGGVNRKPHGPGAPNSDDSDGPPGLRSDSSDPATLPVRTDAGGYVPVESSSSDEAPDWATPGTAKGKGAVAGKGKGKVAPLKEKEKDKEKGKSEKGQRTGNGKAVHAKRRPGGHSMLESEEAGDVADDEAA